MYEQVHEASQRAPDRLRRTAAIVLVSIFDPREWGIEFDLVATFFHVKHYLFSFCPLLHLESVMVISMVFVKLG